MTSAPAPLPINATTAPVQQTLTASGTSPTSTGGSKALTFDQVENYWIQAGGNPQSAAMAAAVADAESGLNPNASRVNPDGTVGVGLWLVPQNGTPPGSTDPLASARATLQLSNNGTDWTQWCSTWSDNNCGQNGGTYLGSGANALMSLGTQSEPASYNVFGATSAGSGVGAGTATSGQASAGTGSSTNKTFMILAVVIVVVLLVVYMSRRKTQGGGGGDIGGGTSEPSQLGSSTIRVPAYERTVPNR